MNLQSPTYATKFTAFFAQEVPEGVSRPTATDRPWLWRTLDRFKHQHSQSQGLQFAPFAWAAAFTTVVARAASALPSDHCLKHQ
jgi:hypothetical protein